ncbi:MAG: rhodanese-like domain-containing protein [Oligoflexia bacterium]|jgi:rhodanese-related sulfurtransferase
MTEGTELILDVREVDEFKAERVPGSLHLPLSQIDLIAEGVLKPLAPCSFVLLCRSGNRAKLAHAQLLGRGLLTSDRSRIFDGGILEWKRQGRPTEGTRAGRGLPIMRQVQLAAGLLTALGATLALTVHPAWGFLSLFVGLGLTVAGSTGFCGMAILLQKMPWNREKSRVTPPKAAACIASATETSNQTSKEMS